MGEQACAIALDYCTRWVKPAAASSSPSAPPSPSPRGASAQAQSSSSLPVRAAPAHELAAFSGSSRDQRATAAATNRVEPDRDLDASAVPVLDPFCGHGSVLAVANARGLDAYGVDLCAASCRVAVKHTVR